MSNETLLYDCDYEQECECTTAGIESSWEWDEEQACWTCSTCGELQWA